jgi:hypothetical protein
MTNNLSEPDDAPWLNLTPQEVEELRYNKQKLTEYGKEKIRALMTKTGEEGALNALDRLYDENNDALRRLAE